MKTDANPPDQEELIEEIKAKQRNTLWPDTVVNRTTVSSFLWKGSPDATLVQRIGFWVFGLQFVLFGILALEAYREANPDDRSFLPVVAAIIFFALGTRIFLNGFRKHRGK